MEWPATWENPFDAYLQHFQDLIGDRRTAVTLRETLRGIIAAGSLICQQIARASSVLAAVKEGARRVHISYYDAANGDLEYAHDDGTGWLTATVDSAGDVGRYTSLALDNAGRPHISYHDATNGTLKYAHLAPCTPVSAVEVTGPVALPAGISGLYTATYAPPSATLPLLSWDNGAAGPQAAYSWPTTGTHALTATATTPCGAVSGTLTVDVFCQPVTGVAATGPHALLAGQVGTYRAAVQPITASRPLTVTWDNGTLGATGNYSWAVPGTYTLRVSATNLCRAVRDAAVAVRVLSEWPYAHYLPLVARAGR
jgi:hypothetical protein